MTKQTQKQEREKRLVRAVDYREFISNLYNEQRPPKKQRRKALTRLIASLNGGFAEGKDRYLCLIDEAKTLRVTGEFIAIYSILRDYITERRVTCLNEEDFVWAKNYSNPIRDNEVLKKLDNFWIFESPALEGSWASYYLSNAFRRRIEKRKMGEEQYKRLQNASYEELAKEALENQEDYKKECEITPAWRYNDLTQRFLELKSKRLIEEKLK